MKRRRQKQIKTVRKKTREQMVKNLREGKEYGGNFWHMTKQEIKNIKHTSRYSRDNR